MIIPTATIQVGHPMPHRHPGGAVVLGHLVVFVNQTPEFDGEKGLLLLHSQERQEPLAQECCARTRESNDVGLPMIQVPSRRTVAESGKAQEIGQPLQDALVGHGHASGERDVAISSPCQADVALAVEEAGEVGQVQRCQSGNRISLALGFLARGSLSQIRRLSGGSTALPVGPAIGLSGFLVGVVTLALIGQVTLTVLGAPFGSIRTPTFTPLVLR
jgi:hypothetical protein